MEDVGANWLLGVFTACLGYAAATFAYRKTTRDSDKSIFVAAVTQERAKWREELRGNVSEFVRQCVMSEPDVPELLRLKTDIVLRLNPRARESSMVDKHKFDRQILLVVAELFDAAVKGAVALPSDLVDKLELASQELLKQEWEKTKREAETGQERSKQRTGAFS